MKELRFFWFLFGWLLLFVARPVNSWSQDKDSIKNKEQKKPKAEDKSNILVVPFPPTMYTATGDQYICHKSRITPGELNDLVRRSFTYTLMYNMSDLYNVVEPPDDLAHEYSDISILYRITKFNTVFQKLNAYYKGYPDFTLAQLLAPKYVRWGTDCVNDEAQFPDQNRHKYVKANIVNDSIFSDICKKYNAHYVLFITQFEMVTRFKNCSDLQNQVFQRDFYFHYTILDKKGKYIDGGVIGTTFQSNSNDATKIFEKNLGMLSGLIIAEVRRKL